MAGLTNSGLISQWRESQWHEEPECAPWARDPVVSGSDGLCPGFEHGGATARDDGIDLVIEPGSTRVQVKRRALVTKEVARRLLVGAPQPDQQGNKRAGDGNRNRTTSLEGSGLRQPDLRISRSGHVSGCL
jgi:hypothetical protein